MTKDEQKTAMVLLAICARHMEYLNLIMTKLNLLLVRAGVDIEMPMSLAYIPIREFLRRVKV